MSTGRRAVRAVVFLLVLAGLGSAAGSRKWTSRDGKFTTQAEMVDYGQGKVRLRKPDGKEIDVPLKQLSDEDRHWVAEEMRRRRKSGRAGEASETSEAGSDRPDETQNATAWATKPSPGEDAAIAESLGSHDVALKLVALNLSSRRRKRADPLTEHVLGMTNPQTFMARSNGGKSPYEAQFGKLVKKEPEYAMKSPFRAVAHFGAKQCPFALDAVGEKAKGYNRLYFDANGNGDLTDDAPIDTKDVEASGRGNNFLCGFRDIKVPLELGGVEVDHLMSMEVRHSESPAMAYTYVRLTSAAVREGQIEQEGKKVRFLLVDHNSNGRFDDLVAVRNFRSRLYVAVGDVFLVNPSAKKARAAAAPDYYFVNRSVCLGNHFYKIEISPSGDRMKLEPVELSIGYVTHSSPAYRAVVYSDEQGVLMIGGARGQKVALPAGKWKLANYTIQAGSAAGAPTMVAAECSGDAQAVDVRKDDTTELTFGEPFRAEVTAKRTGDQKVSLSLKIVGKGGERCTDMRIKGKRPPNPTFEIRDKAGKIVHGGKFEYG
ncbi:MAG: hypothetical protein JW719_14310 [Pirellulales bacterium]|nr:hypothetical protein [Pirellulales bacterium]